MRIEKNESYTRASAVWFALFGVLLGLLLIVLPIDKLLKIVFVAIGIMTVLYQIPGLAMGLVHFETAAGKISLILSLISMAIGVTMIFFHSEVLMLILGIYLIVWPLLQVILSKDRFARLKTELPKLILGVVLLIIGPAGVMNVLFDVAGCVILGLSVIYLLIVLLVRAGKRAKYENTTGNRVFVDTTGDGRIDTVYVDTTGDGKPDTAKRYRDGK